MSKIQFKIWSQAAASQRQAAASEDISIKYRERMARVARSLAQEYRVKLQIELGRLMAEAENKNRASRLSHGRHNPVQDKTDSDQSTDEDDHLRGLLLAANREIIRDYVPTSLPEKEVSSADEGQGHDVGRESGLSDELMLDLGYEVDDNKGWLLDNTSSCDQDESMVQTPHGDESQNVAPSRYIIPNAASDIKSLAQNGKCHQVPFLGLS